MNFSSIIIFQSSFFVHWEAQKWDPKGTGLVWMRWTSGRASPQGAEHFTSCVPVLILIARGKCFTDFTLDWHMQIQKKVHRKVFYGQHWEI